MKTVKGDRIELRPISYEDTDNIIKWRNSKNVMDHFIVRTSLTRQMHTSWLESRVFTGQVIQFIITVTETGQDIGSVYFRDLDMEKSEAEFGIFIGEEEALNKGYGYETQRLAMDYVFKELKLKRITLRVISDNISAITVYKKCGFQIIEGADEIKNINGQDVRILFMEAINNND